MAAFPIIVSGSAFSITTGSSLTYNQFLATLQYISYKVDEMYLQSDNINQLTTPFSWLKTTPNGVSITDPTAAKLDPNQRAAVLVLRTGRDSAVIDTNSSLQFTLAASAYLEIMFFTDAFSFSYLLGKKEKARYMEPNERYGENKIIEDEPQGMNSHETATLAIFLAALGFVGYHFIKGTK